MDFSKFVEPIADFINFLINFWIYGEVPDEIGSAIGEISIFALGLFLMGIFFNYVVIQFRPFDFNPASTASKSNVGKVEAHAIFGTIPLVFIGAFLFEAMLWVFGIRSRPGNEDMGNFADTVNGHLLMSAATSAIFAFVQLFGDQHKRLKKVGRQSIPLDIILSILGLVAFASFYFAFPLLSLALNVESSVIRWPYIATIIPALILGFAFGALQRTALTESEE